MSNTHTLNKSLTVVLTLASALVFPVAQADGLDMDLAKKSGCLACHSLENTKVGPAWRSVAARYADDSGAQERLEKVVTNGGRGNWNYVTGGIPMIPFGSRVSADNITKLVSGILQLNHNK